MVGKIVIICLVLIGYPVKGWSNVFAEQYLPSLENLILDFYYVDTNHHIYYSDGEELIIYNLEEDEMVSRHTIGLQSLVSSIIVCPLQKSVIMGTDDGRVISYDHSAGDISGSVQLNKGRVTALWISPDGQFIISGTANGGVYKHQTVDVNQIEELASGNGVVTAIRENPERGVVAVSTSKGVIYLFDSRNISLKTKLDTNYSWIRDMAFDNAVGLLFTVGDDGRLVEWRIGDSANIRRINRVRLSRRKLLSVDYDEERKVVFAAGLDRVVRVRTQFGSYRRRLESPVLKVSYLAFEDSNSVWIICCVYGSGIKIVPLNSMKLSR